MKPERKPERKRNDKKTIDNLTQQFHQSYGTIESLKFNRRRTSKNSNSILPARRQKLSQNFNSESTRRFSGVRRDLSFRHRSRPNPPNDIEQNKLIKSCIQNNINEFKKLIKNGEDIDCQDTDGIYLVEIILKNELRNNVENKKEFFDELLSAGLNLQSKKYYPLLSSLIKHGLDQEMMPELINNKININYFGVNKNTSQKYEPPIFMAIKHNKKEIVDILLKNNVDIDVCNSNGEPILNYLLRLPTSLEILLNREEAANYAKKLIDMDVDLNQRDYDGNQAIHHLAKFGYGIRYKDLYNDILNRGININAKNLYGDSPLHFATQFQNHGAMDFLIKKGSELNMHNSNGSNPLYASAHNYDEYAFNMLLEAGAEINSINKYGNNIIHLLILNENTDGYFYNEILKINPKLVNLKNKKGQTPKDKLKMSLMGEKDKERILNFLN